jgi:hypothetical protein
MFVGHKVIPRALLPIDDLMINVFSRELRYLSM